MTRPNARWRVWIALLLGAAGLAAFGDKTPSSRVAEARPVARPAPAAATTRTPAASDDTPVEITALRDRADLFPARPKARPMHDLFAPTTWAPPPPMAKASPPVDPTPPLPSLTYIGKKHEAGSWEVYLTQGTQTLIAREGATLEGDLRVERIAPPEMTLTQLSTGRAMTLGIGDAQ